MSDEQAISTAAGGPYLVSGGVSLSTKTPIVSEHGEPLTWKTEAMAETRAKYALCRCGESSNKPYCDRTHTDIEWDGSDGASTPDYAERAQSRGGEGIEILDDRGVCMHAGFCGNEVTNIWKMASETGDTQVRAQAMAMIERCPSGALSYRVDGEPVEPDLPAGIGIVPDGPFWVTGGVEIKRADGTVLEPRNRVTLCRCGQSGSKPLCDGSHKEAGFTG